MSESIENGSVGSGPDDERAPAPGVDEAQARQRLETERDRVRGLIGEIRDEIEIENSDEHHGELSGYDQHPADAGSTTFEREKDQAVLESLERELAELEAALQRLDDGTYGIDEETGLPIDPARLEARPEARTNVEPPRT